VKKGNPKGINGLSDLLRNKIRFVNRQREAGTRVLLDYQLQEQGISPSQINGYDHVEFTHMTVAAAVASGMADAGLGILAAAKALNLDFVPLWKERYDLVIPKSYYNSPLVQPFLDILHQTSFRNDVESLGGYDVSMMGQIMYDSST
jgi:putative molybdopterin biosynthesis protein